MFCLLLKRFEYSEILVQKFFEFAKSLSGKQYYQNQAAISQKARV